MWLLQGHGEGFSMFSMDNGRQGYAEAKAGSIWGDSQSRAANMDHYTQLLQQGPAVRSSLDSRSSGGLFGGRSMDNMCHTSHCRLVSHTVTRDRRSDLVMALSGNVCMSCPHGLQANKCCSSPGHGQLKQETLFDSRSM